MSTKTIAVIIAVVIIAAVALSIAVAHKRSQHTTPVKTESSARVVETVTKTVTKTTTKTTTITSVGRVKVMLKGSGATFPQPQLEEWIREFMKTHPNIDIEYQGVGSGAGQEQFFKNLTDFCGSDPPLSRSVWLKYKGRVMQVPYILGAVVITYNLPGLNSTVHLKLNGKVIALIYKGVIKYWDDPRIEKLNPNIKLPHHEIIVVHRSDASGTTQIFTTFLHKSAPDVWPSSMVGKLVNWPVDKTGRGVGGKGNAGVVAIVKSTAYSIGYVELAYALENNLPIAMIENKAGNYTLPTISAMKSAASEALKTGLIPKDPLGDFSRDLEAIVYAPGANSYPLTSFSHLIMWVHYKDKSKAEALAEFLEWICKYGDNYMVKGYAPAPAPIKEIIMKAAEKLLERG